MSVPSGRVVVMLDRLLDRSTLGPVLDAAADLFLGSRCAGCGAPGRCWCPWCARTLTDPARRSAPDPAPPGLPEVWSVAANTGPVAAAVIAHKERGELGLARPLGAALARAMAAAACAATEHAAAEHPTGRRSGRQPPIARRGGLVLVPVPTSRQAIRRRGYDPLLRILRAAIRSRVTDGLGVRPRLVSALTVNRPVADQATLGSRERRANLAGAFTVRERCRELLADATVLLVDDLVTTGATLTEAARALAEAGVPARAAAVVAATPRDRRGVTAPGVVSDTKTGDDLRQRVPSRAGSG